MRVLNSKLSALQEKFADDAVLKEGSYVETYVENVEQVLENVFFVNKIKRVPLKDVDVRGEFIAEDYSLNNLLATGSVDLLNEVGKVSLSPLDASDMVGNAINSIEIIAGSVSSKITEENKTEE